MKYAAPVAEVVSVESEAILKASNCSLGEYEIGCEVDDEIL